MGNEQFSESERMKVMQELVLMHEKRIKALETSLMALQVGVGDGSKHKNDGGWFD